MIKYVINKGECIDKLIKYIKLPNYISFYSANKKIPYKVNESSNKQRIHTNHIR